MAPVAHESQRKEWPTLMAAPLPRQQMDFNAAKGPIASVLDSNFQVNTTFVISIFLGDVTDQADLVDLVDWELNMCVEIAS